ncbi:MAG: hypothetical protein J5I93_10290, partial [Pirellulaceae bacterium]|nr:hypothetical protein [Pirellulaceae bacterium]
QFAICNHPSWSFVLQSSDAEAHREFWRTPRTLHFESQLDSHALARPGVSGAKKGGKKGV